MSVVVIGLNHRTRHARAARAHGRRRGAPAQGAARPVRALQRERGRGAVHVQPHRGVRGGRALPRRLPGRAQLLRRAVVDAARGLPAPPLRPLRRRRRAPPVLRGRRARLRGAGRDARSWARSGWRGSGRRARARPAAASTSCSATPSRWASGPAPTPASPATTTSVSQATVELATEHLGTMEGRRVLVIGAGEMGEGMAVALARAGVAEVVVANRTRQRAEALAVRVGGRSVPAGRPGRRRGRRRRGAHLHRLRRRCSSSTTTWPRSWPCGPTGPCSSSTWPSPATSTPAWPGCPASPSSTSTTCGLRRRGHGGPPGRGRAGAAHWSTRRSCATSTRPRPARWPRWWPGCATAPRTSARASSTRHRARLADLDERQRDAVETITKRLAGQAAARAHGAAQGRRRHATRRAPGRGPARPVRPLGAHVPAPPRRHAVERAGPLAGRVRGGRAGARSDPELRRRARLVDTDRRPPPGRAHPRHGRPGRVREGGAGRGARRPRRHGRALGQGPHRHADPPGLVLAAVPRRGDPRDALVGRSLADLAPGATVATGSVRRKAQLAARRPDLTFVDLRGNIGTRLAKVPEGGALVMAAAALERLERLDAVAEVLAVDVMVPQVGPGRAGRRVPGRRRRAARRPGRARAPGQPPGAGRGAGLPGGAGWRVRPARRGARPGARRRHGGALGVRGARGGPGLPPAGALRRGPTRCGSRPIWRGPFLATGA